MKVWVSAFWSKSALMGAIILKTNLNITESNINIMMVGKTRNKPFNKVLKKNDLDHFLSEGTLVLFCIEVGFSIGFIFKVCSACQLVRKTIGSDIVYTLDNN